jgi:hypothetical protein
MYILTVARESSQTMDFSVDTEVSRETAIQKALTLAEKHAWDDTETFTVRWVEEVSSTYLVNVGRTVQQSHMFCVEARSKEDAWKKALERASGEDWGDFSSDKSEYKLLNITAL